MAVAATVAEAAGSETEVAHKATLAEARAAVAGLAAEAPVGEALVAEMAAPPVEG